MTTNEEASIDATHLIDESTIMEVPGDEAGSVSAHGLRFNASTEPLVAEKVPVEDLTAESLPERQPVTSVADVAMTDSLPSITRLQLSSSTKSPSTAEDKIISPNQDISTSIPTAGIESDDESDIEVPIIDVDDSDEGDDE
jgi:hypothetical protein